MNKISSILKITRPENVVITFVAVVIGAIISTGIQSLQLSVIWGAFSLAFACAAGNVINDIYDIEIDKINKPDRVLPFYCTFASEWNSITNIRFCGKHCSVSVQC